MEAPLKQNSVVIIDDSNEDVLLLKKLLQSLNYSDHIITFCNPLEAHQYFEDIVKEGMADKMPAIIFLDLNMPSISGFQFLDTFNKFPKETTENTNFILISSSGSTKNIEKSRKYDNVIKYLIKPLSPIDFLDDDLD